MGKMIILHARDNTELLIDPTAYVFLADGVHTRMYDTVYDVLEDNGLGINESIEQIQQLANG